ncbi:unnamed protein product (mitochondrion) [Plasmodiophora brassicae]|uniref:Cytoplasmic tRNA 2-thiolation protein 1 n=1 Tax=Plasmodiophora brassicae TaxID=37360 RepID=A0A3P3Y5D1_PLABS|nr:unnamed protein product [Plasmodiophora brassicae]
MPLPCERCTRAKAQVRRPADGSRVCTACFFELFEEEIHATVVANRLFERGDHVAIGASGGKDSTVLIHVISKLNRERDYGLNLTLLSIDEGIRGYRDDSLATVQRNREEYGLPLKVLSYADLYGWTMDEIVAEVGLRNNCTFCGVFRRQALDRGAALIGATKVVTGHNADDVAETVLMNLLRGDIARLGRCVDIVTGVDSSISRCKPFKYAYEKEIVMYAYLNKLDYFSTECTYAPQAYRGYAREYIKDLERTDSRTILNIIQNAEQLRVQTAGRKKQTLKACAQCGYMTSATTCKACVLLEGLNKGRPMTTIGSARQMRRMEEATSDTPGDSRAPSLEW